MFKKIKNLFTKEENTDKREEIYEKPEKAETITF